MDLVIVNNDPLNTLLTADSVGVRYTVSTPKTSQGQLGPTSIIRAEGESSTGHVDTLIGHFDLGPSRELKLQLCTTGSELVLHPIVSNGDLAMENSWTFLGPDRRSYKWQIFIQYPVFILDDNSNTLLARYRRAKLGIVSRPRKSFIEITPAGIAIVDLIVVTFVAFMKQRFMIDYASDST